MMNHRTLRAATAALGAFLVTLLPAAAHAWGGEGHSYAAALAVRSLPAGPLKDFWTMEDSWLENASSWPDRWRNRPDNAEAPRHFLDGENFGFGMDLTKVPRPYADVLKIRNYDQLRTDGVVPWTVGRVYKLLVIALREKRWEDAMVQSAYLAHYISDAHVPFHASANFDGQLSQPNQRGIHSRFETQTLQRSIKLTDLKPGDPLPVSDPTAFTLDTLNASLAQVPVILAADKEAAAASGGEYNDAYWNAFIPKARPIAIERLQLAGRALAGLLVAAWNEAGKPALPTSYLNPDRLLPYAPPFTARGETAPPTPEPVPVWIKDSERLRIQTVQLASHALGKTVSFNVLLPADYETSKERYSVLYLLHGASGSYTDWGKNTGIAAYSRTRPFIIVMPDANGDSFYLNAAGHGAVADFFVKELIPAVDKQYRTIARREGRAVAGLSMGGYGAWRLALDNPGVFACAASLSGALNFGEGDPATVNPPALAQLLPGVYGKAPDAATYHQAALLPLVDKGLTNGSWTGPALYFDCGSDDFLIAANRHMDEELMKRGVPYEFAEFRGAHTWPYWDEHVRDVLGFVERHVAMPGK